MGKNQAKSASGLQKVFPRLGRERFQPYLGIG